MWLMHWLFPAQCFYILIGLLGLLLLPAILLAGRFARLHNMSDPSEVVIDEFLGQIFCLVWVPVSGATLLGAFLLFRLFDIVKPFPIAASERLPGGVGIVGDDLLAGLYAGLVLKGTMMLWL